MWVGDEITDEIDDETGNGPVSDVLREAPHTARFRNVVLPEVCCLEQVKLVDHLSGHMKPQEDRLDMGAGHSISFRNKTAADRYGRRDRKEVDRTCGNMGQSQRKVESWDAFQGTFLLALLYHF